MQSKLTLTGFTLIALMSANAAAGANEKLALRVTPNVSSAPSTVTIRAYVEPNVANRRLRVEADSGSFYRSSEVQLEGDQAPTLTEFRFTSLPGGWRLLRLHPPVFEPSPAPRDVLRCLPA